MEGQPGKQEQIAARSTAFPRWPNACRVGQWVRRGVQIENSMSRQTAFRSAVFLILFGIFMGFIALTNPGAISLAMATLLIGVVMMAIATHAGS